MPHFVTAEISQLLASGSTKTHLLESSDFIFKHQNSCLRCCCCRCLSLFTLLVLQLRFPQKVLQMNTVRLPALFTPSQQQSLLLLHSRPLQIRCSSQNGTNLLQALIPQGRLCQACWIGWHAACVVLFEHPILHQHHLTCYCILQLHLVAMMILKNHVTVSSVEHSVFTIQSQKTTRNFETVCSQTVC